MDIVNSWSDISVSWESLRLLPVSVRAAIGFHKYSGFTNISFLVWKSGLLQFVSADQICLLRFMDDTMLSLSAFITARSLDTICVTFESQ